MLWYPPAKKGKSYQVPEGTVFVMGDRRLDAIDSRSSAIGCVGREQIVGRVLFTLWSKKKKKKSDAKEGKR